MRSCLSLIFYLCVYAFCPSTLRAQEDTSRVVVLKGIIIEGNKLTRESVILRELTLTEGDTLSVTELNEACARSASLLLNTRLFNFAEVSPVLTENENAYLKVSLVERWYWWPQVILQFADPNFNTWWETRDFSRINAGLEIYKQNFRGRNEDLRFRFQFGYTKRFGLSYRIPFLSRGQRLGMLIGAAYREQEEITVATRNNRREFFRINGQDGRREQIYELQFTYRPGVYGKHSLTLAGVIAEVRDSLALSYTDYFDNGTSQLNYLRLGYQFYADRRDNRGYPLDGDYFVFEAEQRGLGLLNTDGLSVVQLTTQYKAYHPLARRWYAAAGVRFRTTPAGQLPYYFQEALGYSHQLRGYEYYVIDGQHFAMWRSNLKFALLPRREIDAGVGPAMFTRIHYAIYLNAFFDGGYVWDDRYNEVNPLSNQLQYSTGLGVDFATYYDSVIRLEVALNRLNEFGFFLHFVQPI